MELNIKGKKFYGKSKSYKNLEDAVKTISKTHYRGNHQDEIRNQISKHYESDTTGNAEALKGRKSLSPKVEETGSGEI